MNSAAKTDWNIEEIESVAEAEAQKIALETMKIKDHTVYFIDFPGGFGYSAVVFAEGRHIYYANDYELHHHSKKPEELKELYIKELNSSLFTEAEITGKVKDYDEYKRKSYFLHNYYGMRRERESIFYISRGKEKDAERNERLKHFPIFDPVSFAYYSAEDELFVRHHAELAEQLEAEKEKLKNSFDYWKRAFLAEMWNHEYIYNWQADYDVLRCFGFIEYHGDEENERELYFDELGFGDEPRRAYAEARKEYFSKAEA